VVGLAGALPPGQSLSLRRLADQLEVSFIPVRDALRVLEGECLVVNPAGRSASVAPLDLEEFHAIYRIRTLLEPDLARRSVPQLTEAEFGRLYRAAAQFGGAERSMRLSSCATSFRICRVIIGAEGVSRWFVRTRSARPGRPRTRVRPYRPA
jgi:DNA-binding GntR family transcriptional regulator